MMYFIFLDALRSVIFECKWDITSTTETPHEHFNSYEGNNGRGHSRYGSASPGVDNGESTGHHGNPYSNTWTAIHENYYFIISAFLSMFRDKYFIKPYLIEQNRGRRMQLYRPFSLRSSPNLVKCAWLHLICFYLKGKIVLKRLKERCSTAFTYLTIRKGT